MAHSHSRAGHAAHGHSHAPASFDRAFAVGVGLNVAIVVVQIAFGLLANSLALLADAGHNVSDVLGLLLAWGAAVLSRRLATRRRTYGWRRTSILAALSNALVLVMVTGGIGWEAVRRLAQPEPVAGGVVIGAAAVGALVNAGAALLFLRGRERDMNIRAAFLHLASDAATSLGVAVAGVAILTTGWIWLDPVVSLAIGITILIGTWSLLREAFNLAVDAVPEGVDIQAVESYLSSRPSVSSVHDLHIWGMSTTETALTVHLVLADGALNDALLSEISEELEEHFGIVHTTIQFERTDLQHECALAVDHGH